MKLYNLREKIINEINNSDLPIDAVYFVLEKISSEIISLYNHEIEKLKIEQLQIEKDELDTLNESKKEGDK